MTTDEMIQSMRAGYDCDCGMKDGKYCKSAEIFKKFGSMMRQERDEARRAAEFWRDNYHSWGDMADPDLMLPWEVQE